MTNKLKRVVIKEELVNLTGNYISAIILNQFLYWSERTKDTDKYLREEKTRQAQSGLQVNAEPLHGWIYKTAEDLSDELMLGMSQNTIRKYIKPLVESGYVDERTNPRHRWDKTLQYRPNLVAIQTDLRKMGYSLEGYADITPNEDSRLKICDSSENNCDSSGENYGAIPETTTETTTESDTPPRKTKTKTHRQHGSYGTIRKPVPTR